MKKILIFIAAALFLAGCEELTPVFTGQYPDPQLQKVWTGKIT